MLESAFDELTVNAYPNPFNATTSIEFTLDGSEPEEVTLEVYNLSGARVATLFNGNADAGKTYTVTFDGTALEPGVYFYQLVSGEGIHKDKLILIK